MFYGSCGQVWVRLSVVYKAIIVLGLDDITILEL
jgi:hypothetical protein